MCSGHISVCAAILCTRGRIMLARRRPGKHLAGFWEFPGGKIVAPETPQACLARELYEEFGIAATVGEFICSNKHRYDHLAIELLAYNICDWSGDLIPVDHDQLDWVMPEQLLSYTLSPADIPIAQAITAGGFQLS